MGPGQVRSGAGPAPPDVAGPRVLPEVRPAQTVHFPENFIQQKLKNVPLLHLLAYPSVTLKVGGGPEGVALPLHHPSWKCDFQQYANILNIPSKEGPGNAG